MYRSLTRAPSHLKLTRARIQVKRLVSPAHVEQRNRHSIRVTELALNSLRQNMCPHVSTRRVTPRSSGGCAGESITCAISSSAREARKVFRQMEHDESAISERKRHLI